MKQLTNNQMKELKGQLDSMSYQLVDGSNPNAVGTPTTTLVTTTISSVCKIAQIVSDND